MDSPGQDVKLRTTKRPRTPPPLSEEARCTRPPPRSPKKSTDSPNHQATTSSPPLSREGPRRGSKAFCYNCDLGGHFTEECTLFLRNPHEHSASFRTVVPCTSFRSTQSTREIAACFRAVRFLCCAINSMYHTQSDGHRCFRCGDKSHFADKCEAPLRCDRCGLIGHKFSECRVTTCSRCGRGGHEANECKVDRQLSCRKCGRKGHMARACPNYACRWCGEVGHRPVACVRNQRRRGGRGVDQSRRDKQAFQLERSHITHSPLESSSPSFSASKAPLTDMPTRPRVEPPSGFKVRRKADGPPSPLADETIRDSGGVVEGNVEQQHETPQGGSRGASSTPTAPLIVYSDDDLTL